MIRKFATVYAGHIDIPDRGQDATPANDRRFSNDHLAGVFDKTEAIARVMDRGGWDTLWLAEHHFQPEGYEVIPNLKVMASYQFENWSDYAADVFIGADGFMATVARNYNNAHVIGAAGETTITSPSR